MFYILTLLAIIIPNITFAADGSLQLFLAGIGLFLNNIVLPLILTLAFLFFLINVVRFFIYGSSNEDGQKNAKSLALYGISTFVIIVCFWGLINFMIDGFGFNAAPCADMRSDYLRITDPC